MIMTKFLQITEVNANWRDINLKVRIVTDKDYYLYQDWEDGMEITASVRLRNNMVNLQDIHKFIKLWVLSEFKETMELEEFLDKMMGEDEN